MSTETHFSCWDKYERNPLLKGALLAVSLTVIFFQFERDYSNNLETKTELRRNKNAFRIFTQKERQMNWYVMQNMAASTQKLEK